MSRKASKTQTTTYDPQAYDGPIQRADGTRPYNGYLWPSEKWVAHHYEGDDPRLRNARYDYRIDFVHLADGRYSTSGALYDIEGRNSNSKRRHVFPTRRAAIRASAGRLIRHLRWARKETGWPNYISPEQAEGVLAWIRQTVAREAPRIITVPAAVEYPVVLDIHAKISIMEDRILLCRKAVAREEKKETPDAGFCERGKAAIAELAKVLGSMKASAEVVDIAA